MALGPSRAADAELRGLIPRAFCGIFRIKNVCGNVLWEEEERWIYLYSG